MQKREKATRGHHDLRYLTKRPIDKGIKSTITFNHALIAKIATAPCLSLGCCRSFIAKDWGESENFTVFDRRINLLRVQISWLQFTPYTE